MDENKWMAERFEEHRTHLRAVACRTTAASGGHGSGSAALIPAESRTLVPLLAITVTYFCC
jgi:hypothetical protein